MKRQAVVIGLVIVLSGTCVALYYGHMSPHLVGKNPPPDIAAALKPDAVPALPLQPPASPAAIPPSDPAELGRLKTGSAKEFAAALKALTATPETTAANLDHLLSAASEVTGKIEPFLALRSGNVRTLWRGGAIGEKNGVILASIAESLRCLEDESAKEVALPKLKSFFQNVADGKIHYVKPCFALRVYFYAEFFGMELYVSPGANTAEILKTLEVECRSADRSMAQEAHDLLLRAVDTIPEVGKVWPAALQIEPAIADRIPQYRDEYGEPMPKKAFFTLRSQPAERLLQDLKHLSQYGPNSRAEYGVREYILRHKILEDPATLPLLNEAVPIIARRLCDEYIPNDATQHEKQVADAVIDYLEKEILRADPNGYTPVWALEVLRWTALSDAPPIQAQKKTACPGPSEVYGYGRIMSVMLNTLHSSCPKMQMSAADFLPDICLRDQSTIPGALVALKELSDTLRADKDFDLPDRDPSKGGFNDSPGRYVYDAAKGAIGRLERATAKEE